MDVKDILDTYYNDVTEQLYPDFWDNDSYEEELLPMNEDCMIGGIYEAKPEYYDALSSDGYQEVMLIQPYGRMFYADFIGVVIGNRLCDVTNDVERIVTEYEFEDDEEDWSPEAMRSWGRQLYNQYGPDVDVMDMSEYDAESYLLYRDELNRGRR